MYNVQCFKMIIKSLGRTQVSMYKVWSFKMFLYIFEYFIVLFLIENGLGLVVFLYL